MLCYVDFMYDPKVIENLHRHFGPPKSLFHFYFISLNQLLLFFSTIKRISFTLSGYKKTKITNFIHANILDRKLRDLFHLILTIIHGLEFDLAL